MDSSSPPENQLQNSCLQSSPTHMDTCGSLWAGGCWGSSGCKGKRDEMPQAVDNTNLHDLPWSHFTGAEMVPSVLVSHRVHRRSSIPPACYRSSRFLFPSSSGEEEGLASYFWAEERGWLSVLSVSEETAGLGPGKAMVIEKRFWSPCEELPRFICGSLKSFSSFSNRLCECLRPLFKSCSSASLCAL